MNFLFVHQFYHSQFAHVARHLASSGHQVLFLTEDSGGLGFTGDIPGVRKIVFHTPHLRTPRGHYLARIRENLARGQAVASCAEQLKGRGFDPHLIVGYGGSGEIVYLKDVWPKTPLLGYFEDFWHAYGSDVDFDSEFPPPEGTAVRIRTGSAIDLLGLEASDRGLTATKFQRSTYPRR